MSVSRKSQASSQRTHSGSGASNICALTLEQALVLDLEDREDELALRAEVVVDLAERDLGGVRDAAGREVRVAVGEEAVRAAARIAACVPAVA